MIRRHDPFGRRRPAGRRHAIRHPLALLASVLAVALAAAAPAGAAPAAVRLATPLAAARGTPPGLTALRLDRAAVAAFRATGGGRLEVPLGPSRSAVLDLHPFQVFRPGATITATDDHGPHPIVPDLSLYQGTVEGEPGSWALVGLAPGAAYGVLHTRAGRFSLAPMRGGGQSVVDEALAPAPARAFECGTEDWTPGSSGALDLRREVVPDVSQATLTRLECDAAVDCDWEFYSGEMGSDLAAATDYVTTLIATVSLIYQKELNVQIRLAYLNIWTTSADPYSATTTTDALPEFRSWWNANRTGVSRDIAHLISGKGLGGGIAYINTLCSTSNSYSVSAVNGIYSYPTNSTTWDVEVIAHEMGHNFGAYHTQSCYWQSHGYVPPGALLDSCVAAEGSCYSGPTGIVPPDKGTIMSYCHLVGAGISNIRYDFHPVIGPFLRAAAENGCLQTPSPQPPVSLAASLTSSGAHLTWTATTSPGVVRYDVYRSAYQLDLAPALFGSTTGTSYDDPTLGTWYYKVKAVFTADESPFSNEVRASPCSPGLPQVQGVGVNPLAVATGDFNGDGITDLAVANFGGNSVSILLGNGSLGVGDGTFTPGVTVGAGSYPTGIAVADFDRDGILDLAVCDNSGAPVTLLRGQGTGGVGDGTFAFQGTTPAGAGPWGIAAGDFDEDGIVDLAVSTGSSNVAILHGHGTDGVGDFTFDSPVNVSSGSGPHGIALGDFNHDGVTDLAVANMGGTVRILLGNGSGGRGDGSFTQGDAITVQSLPNGIATGDFNRDGITDLAVTNPGSGTVSVLLGTGSGGVGDGHFATPVNYPAGANPYEVAVADWDGDGIADLAVPNFGSVNTVSILTGDGSGGFSAPQPFAAGASPRDLVARDLNGDGTPDLAVVDLTTSGKVSTLLASCGTALPVDIHVTAPNDSELWVSPSEHTITWSHGAGVVAVDVELSRDDGVHWEPIARGVTGTSFTWTVTPPATDQAWIRVRDSTVPGRSDESDSRFSILPQSALAVAGPVPPRLALSGVAPNPTRHALWVWFTLPDDAPARLELVDLAGRRVRSVEVGRLGAGPHRVSLADPGPPGPGIYVVRLTRGGASLTRKVTVLR